MGDAPDLGSGIERCEGSNPSSRTTPKGVEAPQHSGPRRREGEEEAKTRAMLLGCVQRTVQVGDGPGEVPETKPPQHPPLQVKIVGESSPARLGLLRWRLGKL